MNALRSQIMAGQGRADSHPFKANAARGSGIPEFSIRLLFLPALADDFALLPDLPPRSRWVACFGIEGTLSD